MIHTVVTVSEQEIRNHSLQGQFYNHSSNDWNSIGSLEWLLRSIFYQLGCSFSVEQACTMYSWQSIDNMATIPEEIQKNIEHHFTQSRSRNHYLNAASPSITAIYYKTLPQGGQCVIMQDAKQRSFRVLKDGTPSLTVVSSAYGRLDFYETEKNNQLGFVNTLDKLREEGMPNRTWSVKVASDYASLWDSIFNRPTRIDLFSPTEEKLFTVAAEGDSTSFVFREPTTQKIVAIAMWDQKNRWSSEPGRQTWQVAKLPDGDIPLCLLTWMLLKHSQKHLPSPNALPFVENFKP
jgi:hypothetical protein